MVPNIIVDANVVIAYFRREELHHSKALELLQKPDSMGLPEMVFGEILTVLSLREGLHTAQKAAQLLHQNGKISIIQNLPQHLVDIIREFNELSAQLSVPDLCCSYWAEKLEVPLMTFDQRLERAHKKRLLQKRST